MKDKIKNFLKKNEVKLVLLGGFFLVSALSFQAGILKGQKAENQPIILEKPIERDSSEAKKVSESQNLPPKEENASQKEIPVSAFQKPSESQISIQKSPDCLFMGSKNSDKYHRPDCHFAKRIKPENIVCFSSEDEAQSKGYQPDKSCVK